MTNHQDQPDRRARIVDAAFHVIAERGYAAASIKAIARAAGVAPGLVHYYFASKEDLLIEVLRTVARGRRVALDSFMRARRRDRAAALLRDVLRNIRQNPSGYRLRFELFALGLREPALQPGTRDLLESGRTAIGGFLAELGDAELARPLASVMLAAVDGLALQHLIDPDFDLDQAFGVLTRMQQAVLNTDPTSGAGRARRRNSLAHRRS
ncbi:MAG: TetR/AcrR family transcriptional regulator [Chloroflexi bacterium]|nr:TetR/AcrR family transcriptional regulator [Chloroflexota bacterium]